MTNLTHVKWISPNDPIIKIARNDARLYINKRELVDLHRELGEFLAAYADEFTPERIDNKTEFDNSDNWNLA